MIPCPCKLNAMNDRSKESQVDSARGTAHPSLSSLFTNCTQW